MTSKVNAETRITCSELVELVTDYLERALAEPDRVRFERHLAQCEWCTIYVAQMRQVIDTLGALHADSLSPTLREALMDAFRDWNHA